jgi:Domain of unknown function (DUF4190)
MSYDAPPPPQYYGQPYGAPRRTNPKSIWALVLGILGVLCCGPLGIAAIFVGRSAQREIAATGEAGNGMAMSGVILGFIALALMVLGFLLFATGVLTLDTFDSTGTSTS